MRGQEFQLATDNGDPYLQHGVDHMTKTRKNRHDLQSTDGRDGSHNREPEATATEATSREQKTTSDEEEIRNYVEQRRESIRKGARRANKRFRL